MSMRRLKATVVATVAAVAVVGCLQPSDGARVAKSTLVVVMVFISRGRQGSLTAIHSRATACPPQLKLRPSSFEFSGTCSPLLLYAERPSPYPHCLDSDDTKDRKLGRAIHVKLFEPDRFNEIVRVADPCCAILKSGNELPTQFP